MMLIQLYPQHSVGFHAFGRIEHLTCHAIGPYLNGTTGYKYSRSEREFGHRWWWSSSEVVALLESGQDPLKITEGTAVCLVCCLNYYQTRVYVY